MSFRWFIYLCALCGAWCALIGWGLGRSLDVERPEWQAAFKALSLGILLALGLGLVDSLWNVPMQRLDLIAQRVLVAVVVGSIGGLMGGMIGQLLFSATGMSLFLVLGWTLTGLLIGTSLGAFELLAALLRNEDSGGARRKLFNGLLGGTLGGFVGGLLSVVLRTVWAGLFHDRPAELLWSPSATGFVALGLCIGLLVGLAQVVLRQAWLRVESGFRPGRELILSKGETVLGRAEGCDLGLFGDAGVEPRHARIVLRDGRYCAVDGGTRGGTFVNDVPVSQPVPLRDGDVIRVGRSVLRFRERHSRAPLTAR